MALPQFVQSGVPTFTFPKSRAVPMPYKPQAPRQVVATNGDGSVQVAHFFTERFIEGTFLRIPTADALNFLAFLEDPLVLWRLYPFTFTDEWSQSYTVRWWGEVPYDPPMVVAGLHTITIRLRVELP